MAHTGHVLYALAVAGLGVLSLLSGDFAYVWQPVPAWVPLRVVLAYLSGALLLTSGVGLLVRRVTRVAALVLTANFFVVWLLLLHLPKALANPQIEDNWSGCGENAALVAGGWIILALSSGRPTGRAAYLLGESGVRFARRLYAVGLPLVGLSHFIYARGATDFVPTWLPLRLGWVYLTGAGHIAAGLAIFFGVLPRLAAALEALQITSFVLLVHAPWVFGAPGQRLQWTMLFVSSAIAAAAWIVAGTFRRLTVP
jgi:uncharacterized membrane protein